MYWDVVWRYMYFLCYYYVKKMNPFLLQLFVILGNFKTHLLGMGPSQVIWKLLGFLGYHYLIGFQFIVSCLVSAWFLLVIFFGLKLLDKPTCFFTWSLLGKPINWYPSLTYTPPSLVKEGTYNIDIHILKCS